MQLKKGDTVVVLSGKDKGKKEKILRVDTRSGKIRVENVMVVKRHTKPSQKFQGGIIEKPSLISVGKVMLICPLCSKPTRISKQQTEDNKQVRICKKCGEAIDKD